MVPVVGLQFRDLRHECGSRLLESGWSLHDVRDMLGHTNVTTTNNYLYAGLHRLHDNMRRFGTGGGQSLPNVAQRGDEESQPLGKSNAICRLTLC